MATPTSSSNRSKRKTNKPVTQGQSPQRANRQKVSKANVTNSTQRTNNGTAKVTTGKGGSTPKALPAGKPGGPLVSGGARPKPTSTRVEPVKVRNVTPKPKALPPGKPASLPAGKVGGALAKAAKAGLPKVKGGAGLGGAVTVGVTGGQMLGSALIQNRKDRDAKAAAARPKAKPEMSEAQKRGAVRLGLAQPSDVGNKTTGSAGRTSTKPEPKPSPKPQPSSSGGGAPKANGGGNRYADTQPGGSPRGSSPAPSRGGGGGSSTSPIHTYKGHGSDLHVGRHKTLAEHRAAVNRGKGGDLAEAQSQADMAKIKQGPPNPSSPSKPDVGYKPKTQVDGSKFKGGSATNNTSTAYSSNTNLLDKKPNSITEAAKKREEDKKRRGY